MHTDNLLRLDANENSLGMAESARQAVVDTLDNSFRYPDAQRAKLIGKIALANAVTEDHVLLGNGSIESIRMVVQMLYQKGLKTGQPFQLVAPTPTFACAELYADSLGIPVVSVPLMPDSCDLDFDELQSIANAFDGISLLYICNPNNPTGIITSTAKLRNWVTNAPNNHYFLLDEAYSGYVTDPSFESGIEWIKQGISDNLIVARTFSKLFALAAMRVGYVITNPQMASEIGALMSVDNTNLSAAVAAIATLDDNAFLALSLHTTNQSRQMVETTLDELGLRYLPSQTNFIFHEVKGDVKVYIERMHEHGIVVGREFPPIQSFSRVTLGTPDEMTVFIETLRLFREKGWV
ncbi:MULTISPECIES: histidinol-phosphate transaminase [unclassified Psychrobacter]|uniref:pyridoxal phosphate-dependent aminotransferase n=1 Tax=unclassified Psychrobacter TaxID=196806 RepID=UPI0025B60262|nr:MULTISPECIES: histidinol-phosphate transaminase [unclassified Psychrobacter]MDN3453324.1 histidinol-phosphate transaminase [Psychrobacter sp. APC 3350]MDN3502232.1 histidinol-phosphate transaminase [Psychrobacter sp. 5A.1]